MGLRDIFVGWGLSLAKDSLGSAVFFSAFEYVKAQDYYRFVTWYYGGLARGAVDVLASRLPRPAWRAGFTAASGRAPFARCRARARASSSS